MIWDNLKNPNKSILVKKKDKQYRQSGIPLTMDSYLFMKPNLAKNQLWIRSSHQTEIYSNILVEQFTITCDGKEAKIYKVLKRKTISEKIQETLSNF